MKKRAFLTGLTLSLGVAALTASMASMAAAAAPPTGYGFNDKVDYTVANFAYSPNLRKFVDMLPGLGAANQNGLGQYITVATPDTNTYPGSDYYEIGLKQYKARMHSDLPMGTLLRGYYQKNPGTDNSSQYLGPLIIAERDRAVRIKFYNELLPAGQVDPLGGDLPLPVDTTIMGAGMGPMGMMGGNYTQNRADLHLHGGLTPWISDGTPHQWITPAGELSTTYLKGDSFQNVPDMVGPGKSIPNPLPGDGMGTYYYPNQQSARLMFYHDHSYGITRLNVYAGEAAGYLLVDNTEKDLIASGVLPNQSGFDKSGNDLYHFGIPLIIQDRTFVNDSETAAIAAANFAALNLPANTPATPLTIDVDPRWSVLLPTVGGGNFWFPHEYMPNEDIFSDVGFNEKGRWDYGPFMIPPMIVKEPMLPTPTLIPEAFGDTPVVNGTAFPYLELPPTAVRFRILNACNDRMLNLQWYFAATPTGTICDGTTAVDPATCTEVSMVEASNYAKTDPTWPATWPKDGRDGGVPDWKYRGPSMVLIGNEAGFLAKPAVIPPQPIDFDYNRRSVTFGGVTSKSLFMAPAFRSDVVVDFSNILPGAVLILYNDAPAPMPLYDTRNDLFTDSPDKVAEGGAPPTPPAFGPNTRTIMQLRISGTPIPFDMTKLVPTDGSPSMLSAAYAVSQDPPLVPSAAFNDAYPGKNYKNVYANSVDETLNITNNSQPVDKVMTTLPGIGYNAAPLVQFYGGNCNPVPRATAYLNGVTGITLVTAGSGYTSAPTVTIALPNVRGGLRATAAATVSGGVITTITVTNPGWGYTVAPIVTITGGGATVQATATATITLGSVGAIVVDPANAGMCAKAPLVQLKAVNGGTGAAASALLLNDMVLDGKNLVEGFDMEFGRMNAVLGSTPNPLTPTVGAGPIIGANFYIDPPTEIMKAGETRLWRLTHLGVDSHAIHFHLFNVQVVNRVDWTNTIKPPYEDEIGWKETIRTNPFEDIIVAVKPVAMNLPFALPDSNRVLDVTMPPNVVGNFSPVAPPPGVPAVAQITNVMTNFGWEYVWHCHLLGHEENDMMRPLVLLPGIPVPKPAPASLAFGLVGVATPTPPQQSVNVVDGSAVGTQNLFISSIAITGNAAGDYSQTNNCIGTPLPPATGTPPGPSCSINVTFNPTAAGSRPATLSIVSNGTTVNVPLSGTGLLPPAAPSNVRLTAAAPTTITVRWRDNSTNEASFEVYREYPPGTGFVKIATLPASTSNNPSWNDTVPAATTTPALYSYYMTASNIAGSSAPSPTATLDFSIPAAPTGLASGTIVNLTGSTARVPLSWTDNSSNETAFILQRSTSSTFGTFTSFTINTPTTTYNDQVTRGGTYYYRVRAANSALVSPWSSVLPVTVP